ncbi:hypothetical protein Glove_108g62 [Diversispora epigaea]|uniref:Uncharacterized protein n=1 Tax=Diversispora epigaea TaxID=1348612 RepID=A0A397J5B0_9GLOM|nr:hypothetical protein Glove_108g62 [Diversispora epigaea]
MSVKLEDSETSKETRKPSQINMSLESLMPEQMEDVVKHDRKDKEKIYRRLANSTEMHNPNWDVDVNAICVVRGNNFRPDVGIWFQTPSLAQRSRPIANLSPPLEVWIEVIVLNFC